MIEVPAMDMPTQEHPPGNSAAAPARCRRILFIDHTAKLGGGEIALLNLVTSLDHSRFEPIVLLFSDGPLAVELQTAGIDTRFLPLSSKILDTRKDTLGFRTFLKLGILFRSIGFTLRLARCVRKCRPDLVHTNSLKADIIGGLAARLAGVRVIWHVRDRISTDYLPRSVVIIFRWLARWIPTLIVANSASTLATLHLPKRRRSEAIYSGINLQERARIVHDGTPQLPSEADSSSDHKVPVIGLVGRISPWKGQHIFIEAAEKVRRSFPKAHFKIVGAPLFEERAYEQQIHDQVRALGLEEAIEFTGFRKDVAAVVAGFDILVHASTSGEPFGQVVIEGMAASKAVVATNGGGIPEIVVDGVTGLLVPMGDSTALANAICHLLANPDLAHRMGQHGRRRVLEHFTIGLTVQRLERLYSEILDVPKDARPVARPRGPKLVLRRRRPFQILLSIAGPCCASLTTFGFNLLLHDRAPKHSFYFVAIVAVARWINLPSALLSLIISDLLICFLAFPPNQSLRIELNNLPQMLAFNALSVFTAILVARLERGKRLAESAKIKAETASARANFLASALTAFAGCASETELCATLGRMAASRLCDWCVIDLLDETQGPRRVCAVHRDAEMNAIARQLLEFPPDIRSQQWIAKTLRDGCIEFARPASGKSLKDGVLNGRHLELLDRLGYSAFLIVPLTAGGEVLGTMALVRSDADNFFNPHDVALGNEIAIRAGLFLENFQ